MYFIKYDTWWFLVINIVLITKCFQRKGNQEGGDQACASGGRQKTGGYCVFLVAIEGFVYQVRLVHNFVVHNFVD